MTVPDAPTAPDSAQPISPDGTRRPRVLILGGGGMLGHKLWQTARPRLDTYVTVRDARQLARHPGLDAPGRVLDGVDADRPETVDAAIARVRPDVIVNAIGLIKQRPAAHDPVASIRINALFPHLLRQSAAAHGARVIHISTDCVFSGATGGYRESDPPDAADLYGRSKALGELDGPDVRGDGPQDVRQDGPQNGPGALTLRTSMIGRELSRETGLVEWFLGRRGRDAQGFTHAIFSGLTTPVLASLIVRIIEDHSQLAGLYHVAAGPIDKHRLLQLLNDAFGARVAITPSDALRIDRSLDGSRFRDATGFVAPTWEAMAAGLADDPTPYDQWRLAE
jgi:dTDP-4-dehydrorhamnose reductase